MSPEPEDGQLIVHALRKSAKREKKQKKCALRTAAPFRSAHPEYCSKDEACSSGSALSTAVNVLSIVSPGNPEYVEDLSRLC